MSVDILGMMSGTSGDGIDSALVRFFDDNSFELLGFDSYDFSSEVKKRIQQLMNNADAKTLTLGSEYISVLYACAYNSFVKKYKFKPDYLAVHGQTVWHNPQTAYWDEIEVRGTMQLINAASLGVKTGISVISDFRSADMAAGGQGAPLVPYSDRLFYGADIKKARLILNIGGMANLTLLGPTNAEILCAFDTGPGNVLMDLACAYFTNGSQTYDKDGILASKGNTCEDVLNNLLDDKFFRASPPKSTGREQFGRDYFLQTMKMFKSETQLQDILSTYMDLTVESVASGVVESLKLFEVTPPAEIVVAGGGYCNKELLKRLESRLAGWCVFKRSSEFKVPHSMREAMAFAALGNAFLKKIPANCIAATGAQKEVVLGQCYYVS